MSAVTGREIHFWFNVVEAAFWVTVGALVVVQSRKASPGLRRTGAIAGLTFLAFAVTDLVELQTGAWYRPWWLFVSKAACVLVLAGCYYTYRQHTRRIEQYQAGRDRQADDG